MQVIKIPILWCTIFLKQTFVWFIRYMIIYKLSTPDFIANNCDLWPNICHRHKELSPTDLLKLIYDLLPSCIVINHTVCQKWCKVTGKFHEGIFCCPFSMFLLFGSARLVVGINFIGRNRFRNKTILSFVIEDIELTWYWSWKWAIFENR